MKKLIFLVLLALPVIAQTRPKWSATASLDISATGDLKDRISSVFSRELRALGDVTIVSEKPDYEISINAMEVSNKSGVKSGWAMSVVVVRHFYLDYLLKDIIAKEETKAVLKLYLDDSASTVKQGLWSGGDYSDLTTSCQGEVAQIDTQLFEKRRQLFAKAFPSK